MVMWLVRNSPFANSSRFGSRWESAAFSLNFEPRTLNLHLSRSEAQVTLHHALSMNARVAVLFPTKVLGNKIKLRRPLSSGLRPCALHGMKVLLDLNGKGVKLLVDEAFDKK